VAARPQLIAGERLAYRLVEAGSAIGWGELETPREGDRWRLEQRYGTGPEVGRIDDVRDLSRVWVGDALKPLASERTIRRADGTAEGYAIDYAAAEQRIHSTVTKGGEIEQREFRLRDHAYDNESAFWLWRSLDLREGYLERYVSVNPLERSQQTVELRVTERTTIEVPAGSFEVWRLQVRNGRATRVAWIEVAAPHRLIQWDNGSTLMQLAGPR
jgi:hypothetical protein